MLDVRDVFMYFIYEKLAEKCKITYSVNLVDEDDGGCSLLGLSEQVTHPRRPQAP